MSAGVYITEAVDEQNFGFDWLRNNNCKWLFSSGRIVVDGVSIQLQSHESKANIRLIFVREYVEVPRDSSVSVSVHPTYANLNAPQSAWLAEPIQVKPGLLAARTLLPHDDTYASNVFTNVSGGDQLVGCGHSQCIASPCVPNTTNYCVTSDEDPSTQTLMKCATIVAMTGDMDGDCRMCSPLLTDLSDEQREIAFGLIQTQCRCV